MLNAEDLAIGYHRTPLAAGLNLELRLGELVCLVGPNGAGKSTLLRTLAGMQPPLRGVVRLAGKALHHLPAEEIAKQLAVVLTGRVDAGNLSAYALVALGRYPYTDWRGRLKPQDEAAAQHAMRLTNCAGLASRPIHELSDGERQRVMIARALAQEPRVLLLDEPTAFLDLPRRVELFQLLKRLSREPGCATLLATHDLDLALRTADRLWLLAADGAFTSGLPEELALNGAFASAFKGEGVVFDHAAGTFTLHQPTNGPVSVAGNGIATAWTRRALERIGYTIQSAGVDAPLRVTVDETEDGPQWRVSTPRRESSFNALSDLVDFLKIMDAQP